MTLWAHWLQDGMVSAAAAAADNDDDDGDESDDADVCVQPRVPRF